MLPRRSCTFSNASVQLGRQGLDKRGIKLWQAPKHFNLHASNCGNQSVVIPGPGLPGPISPSGSSIRSSSGASLWGERGWHGSTGGCQMLPALLLLPACHVPPTLQTSLPCAPGSTHTVGPHLQDFSGKKSTMSTKPNSVLNVLTAGSGAGAMRLSVRLAARPLHPRQALLASVAFRALNSSVVVSPALDGRARTVVAAVHDTKGRPHTLRWAGTRSLTLADGLQLGLQSPRRLAIRTPHLTVTVSQVRWGCVCPFGGRFKSLPPNR